MGVYLVLQVRFSIRSNHGGANERQDVNIPMQIQPQIFGFLSLVGWGQVLYYGQ